MQFAELAGFLQYRVAKVYEFLEIQLYSFDPEVNNDYEEQARYTASRRLGGEYDS